MILDDKEVSPTTNEVPSASQLSATAPPLGSFKFSDTKALAVHRDESLVGVEPSTSKMSDLEEAPLLPMRASIYRPVRTLRLLCPSTERVSFCVTKSTSLIVSPLLSSAKGAELLCHEAICCEYVLVETSQPHESPAFLPTRSKYFLVAVSFRSTPLLLLDK